MKPKISAIIVAVVLAAIFFVILSPVVHRGPFHEPWVQSGPPIAQSVAMTVGQDQYDPRVLVISMKNISNHEVSLNRRNGHVFENFDVSVKDNAGHVAPITDTVRKAVAAREVGWPESSWQKSSIPPGGQGGEYHFDLLEIADLSKLSGDKLWVTVTYTPRGNLSGEVSSTAVLKRPMVVAAAPTSTWVWPVYQH